MKPRIRIWRGMWHCYVPGGAIVWCGLGFDAAHAYADWWRLVRLGWMKTEAAADSAAQP